MGIIGREEDKKKIVAMLLSDTIENTVSIVSITGVGGIGKTALANHVFNDDRVQSEFDLKFWVCVQTNFSLIHIVNVILQEFFGISCYSTSIGFLQQLLLEKIRGKRYLLVLDDVWNEDYERWDYFISFFTEGGSGSRILITTRLNVSDLIGKKNSYKLSMLSEKDSWNLFKSCAFLPRQQCDAELVDVGKRLLEKCWGIPLYIKIMGSFLYGKDKSKWFIFETSEVRRIETSDFRGIEIIRSSYNDLDPVLKRCFAFCSIFPADYVFQKEVLINLWLALGYLDDRIEDSSEFSDEGEKCFSMLLRRCFFQDIKQNEYAEVISFKMHDLVHDFAQVLASELDFNFHHPQFSLHRQSDASKNNVHLFFSESDDPQQDLFDPNNNFSQTLHTILNLRGCASCSSDVGKIISNFRKLRILDLHNMALQTLPNTFEQVPYLRFLDLSHNEELRILPASITKLHFLQVLRLSGCKNLTELPILSQLPNLRCLNVDGCNKFVSIIQTLTMSVVGRDDHPQFYAASDMEWNAVFNLRGHFLTKMELFVPTFTQELESGTRIAMNRTLLLTSGIKHSHRSSKQVDACKIKIQEYQGMELLSGAPEMSNSVPSIVKLKLARIRGLQHLTPLRHLSHLKELHLQRMWNVECIESDAIYASTSRATESVKLFPSLEKLVLEMMPKLKGWWRDFIWNEMEEDNNAGCLFDENGRRMEQHIFATLPCLRDLSIQLCPNMTYFPPCPLVKQLKLQGINEELTFCMEGGVPKPVVTMSSEPNVHILGLEKLIVCYDARILKSVFREFDVAGIVDISINYCYEEQDLGIAREVFQRCASSLQNLSIDGLYNLKSLSEGIEHLTNLQSFSIKECSKLDLEEVQVEMDEGMPWKSLQSLSSLTLDRIPKMVNNLPKGLQYLTSLQSLHIKRCNNLKAFGECLSDLTSLQAVHIEDCKNLKTIPEYLKLPTSKLELHIKNCPELESG